MQPQLLLTQTQTLAPQMRLMLSVLSMNHQELTAFVQSQYEENPLLDIVDVRAESMDMRVPGAGVGFMADIATKADIKEALRAQLDILSLSAREQKICRMLIALLDEDGFLREDLSEYIRLAHLSPEEVDKAIQEVQSLDPPGVCARDVPEYLCLLLHRRGEKREVYYELVKNHYEDMAAGRYGKIAKTLSLPESEAKALCEHIRSLKPASMGGDTAPYVAPDIIIEEDKKNLIVHIADADLRLILDESSPHFSSANFSPTEKSYFRQKKKDALFALRALEMRNVTLRQVAESLIRAQKGFFLYDAPLMPLLQSNMAASLGMSNSTISRAVKGKWLLCRQGIFPLPSFFMRNVHGHARASVKDALALIVKRNPALSDAALCELLEKQGIHIARRTVTKYRAEMGLKKHARRKE